MEFRILSTNVGAQTHASRPGLCEIRPEREQLVRVSVGGAERIGTPSHVNSLELQWRSPSGNPVNLRRGDMAVQYHTATLRQPCRLRCTAPRLVRRGAPLESVECRRGDLNPHPL